jgi:DNA polymerase sigma
MKSLGRAISIKKSDIDVAIISRQREGNIQKLNKSKQVAVSLRVMPQL